MSWDFSTEPEFDEKLRWMRDFVRDEVFPLEVLDVDNETFMRVVRSLQDEVKKRGLWLLPLLDGKIRSGFWMTEPMHAGSDPVLMSTTAVLEGDEWVINGHKWFTTNGMIADFLIVMAVTEPDAGPYEAASMIIVPKDAPGLNRVRNIPTMAGEHERFGYGHSEILYEDCRVPKENLLGRRGEGFLIAQIRLGPGRIHHCMRWLGQAQRAFDMLCERALQREALGGPPGPKQTLQKLEKGPP